MPLLVKSALWLALFLLAVGSVLFLLKRRKKLSRAREFALGDLANFVAVLFAVFSLAFAIASYQDAAKSSEQQVATLNSSKAALEVAVGIAREEKAQLDESVKLSKQQIDQLTTASSALQSQLPLANQQRKEELARLAKKPLMKVNINVFDPPSETAGPVEFIVEIRNEGSASLQSPKVLVESADEDLSDASAARQHRAKGEAARR